jgi:hypothetical protein
MQFVLDLDRPRHIERRRLQAQQTPVRHMIERRTQAAIVVILKRDKAEGLEHNILRLSHRAEDLSHSAHRARLRLKRNFHEIALGKRTRQFQQPTRSRNSLEFSFSVSAIFESNRSQDRSP